MPRILNARLRDRPGLHTLRFSGGRIAAIEAQAGSLETGLVDIDAAANLVVAPFIEPHIHLDAALTAGQPAWNASGTLFEGIERWAERKAMVTHEDTKSRAHATLRMLAEPIRRRS